MRVIVEVGHLSTSLEPNTATVGSPTAWNRQNLHIRRVI